jgi:hypothetical protein
MKRHATLAAFLVTVAVVVPAAWHSVDADLERDGKHLRPLQKTLVLDDGTKVTLDVDRAVVMTGDTVTATLRAFSDQRKEVAIDLHALHTRNYENERVSTPWHQIDKETIQLVATREGGKPVTTRIKLGERPDKKGLTDSFQIMIAKHGTKFPKHPFEFGGNGDDQVDYDAIDEGLAAATSIRGWSGNNLALAIHPEGKIVEGQPFTVEVRVTNTTGAKQFPLVDLTTEEALTGNEDPTTEAPLSIERVDEDSSNEADPGWKRGAVDITKFRVTPHGKGLSHVTFLASAHVGGGPGDGAYGPGAMDAQTFEVSQPAREIAAR